MMVCRQVQVIPKMCKVDVICSSPILAKRDMTEWAGFFRHFGLTCAALPVGNSEDGYGAAYGSDVVYGTVHDFSADVLKEEFDGKVGHIKVVEHSLRR